MYNNEYDTFTPLIFSINGGLNRETSTFYSRVVELLAVKRNSTKAETITWLRRKFSFNLIRSSMFTRYEESQNGRSMYIRTSRFLI